MPTSDIIRFPTGAHFYGRLSSDAFDPPPGSLANAAFSSTPADALDASKQEHQFQIVDAMAHGSAAADRRIVVHVVRGVSGTLVELFAGVTVAAIGDSTLTLDLKKNGTTVLTGVITIDNGDAAFALVSGTFSGTALAAGDVLEFIWDATVGTGTLPQGAFALLTLREDAE